MGVPFRCPKIKDKEMEAHWRLSHLSKMAEPIKGTELQMCSRPLLENRLQTPMSPCDIGKRTRSCLRLLKSYKHHIEKNKWNALLLL